MILNDITCKKTKKTTTVLLIFFSFKNELRTTNKTVTHKIEYALVYFMFSATHFQKSRALSLQEGEKLFCLKK